MDLSDSICQVGQIKINKILQNNNRPLKTSSRLSVTCMLFYASILIINKNKNYNGMQQNA